MRYRCQATILLKSVKIKKIYYKNNKQTGMTGFEPAKFREPKSRALPNLATFQYNSLVTFL